MKIEIMKMGKIGIIAILVVLSGICPGEELFGQQTGSQVLSPVGPVEVWMTTQDGTKKLSRETDIAFVNLADKSDQSPAIEVVPGFTYQMVDGMGSSLEPATCYNLSLLSNTEREKTLRALLDHDQGIGMNMMRISIGTPDFTSDPWYSYSDLEKGKTDTALVSFSIEKDKKYIIPILKEALRINPDLVFFASPWSPPGWMKTSESLIGGTLRPEYYRTYAKYFVKFLKAYAAEGIPVFAVTVQNEPGVDREHDNPKWWYPSCHWTAGQERDFIKYHLGPALNASGLKTEIWCYDHNYNIIPATDGSAVFIPEKPGDAGINYPGTILRDTEARKYTSAVAFHGYVGDPIGMSVMHREFPGIPVRFTEGSVFGIRGGIKLTGLFRNYATSYNAWVTMLDDKRKPNNGAFTASRTIVERNSQTNEVSYQLDYYLYGHFMKFIKRGSQRVASEGTGKLSHVAFRDPDNNIVLVVINVQNKNQLVKIISCNKETTLEMPENSMATLKWRLIKKSSEHIDTE
jgi:O-glycosyl hydrolase